MSGFEPNKRDLRELLIYLFNLKKYAAEAHRLLVETYGEVALTLCGTMASSDATYFFTNFRDLNVILIRLSNCFLLFYEPRMLSNMNSRLKVPYFVTICQF